MLQVETKLDELEETPLHARAGNECFACGQANPQGLRIDFCKGDNGEMTAVWTPQPVWEGFRGIIHGGVVSTVLDEAMSKAVTAAGLEALTAELRIRFRRHVVPGRSLRVRSWINSRGNRLVRTEAILVGGDETEYAHAWATFLTLRSKTR